MSDGQQWKRKATLVVAAGADGLDLSGLRFKFVVRQSDNESPNTATIRVYNLAPETVRQITGRTPVEFTRVVLQAGYENASFGVIFDGTIKQFRKGKENATDSYLDILAAAGDIEYNFGVCNATVAAGSNAQERANVIAQQMGLKLAGTGDNLAKVTQADVDAQQKVVDAAKAEIDANRKQYAAEVDAGYNDYAAYLQQKEAGNVAAANTLFQSAGVHVKAYKALDAALPPLESKYAAALSKLEALKASLRALSATASTLVGGVLPRGKVLWGMARALMRCEAASRGATWSIQDGAVQVTPLDGYLPGEAVVLSSLTGMVGIPEQTEQGVRIRCLLNPKLRIGGLVQVDNASINQMSQADLRASGFPVSRLPAGQVPFDKYAGVQMLADVTADGFYRLYVVEYIGDTRGQDWYADLIALAVDKSSGKVLAQ